MFCSDILCFSELYGVSKKKSNKFAEIFRAVGATARTGLEAMPRRRRRAAHLAHAKRRFWI